MKVTFVGTGTMGSITRANQSLLIDNVLFDIGSGIVKKLESLKIYTKFIDYIVISHIHADHFFDIANFLIGRNIRGENSKRLTIIGGAGIRKNIVDLMNFSFGDGILGKYNDIESIYNVDIVELKNGDEYKNDEFCLRAFDLEHDGCKPILGFVFEKNGKKFGYVTDTVFCDNVERIVMEADYLFLDGTAREDSGMHMGVETVESIAKRYPDKRFFAIHRGDYEYGDIVSVGFPLDGECFEVED